MTEVPGNTPTASIAVISDEAMAAFRSAPGCWALDGETLRAGLATVAPLLVSAEAENHELNAANLAWAHWEAKARAADSVVEGLRAELAQARDKWMREFARLMAERDAARRLLRTAAAEYDAAESPALQAAGDAP